MAILVALSACVLCYASLGSTAIKRKACQYVIYADPIAKS
jgi:hypothetical protein